jgi:Glycosyl transferase family 2
VIEVVQVLAIVGLVCAAIPALLFLVNLRFYRPPPLETRVEPISVSVLIPARNEEKSIVAAVEAALASRGVAVEVIVLDDHSDDATATLVARLAECDPRVRLLAGPLLPPGWCGKQHACAVLARSARHSLLVFVDADVCLAPDGLARLAAFREKAGADLVSGIPHQETGTLLEKLVIPLIHFILLGFLPMFWMRTSRHPAFAAGCGQLFLARREAYETMGGHAVIRASLHDGITLPRAFRAAGMATDLCDFTDLATCRMYRGARDLWFGLAKNATEGLAKPAVIVPATGLLLGGQVLPVLLWAVAPLLAPWALGTNALATLLLYYPRLAGMRVFRQSPLGAALHPLGVLVLVAIQWFGLLRATFGKPALWKGRAYLKLGTETQNTQFLKSL